MMHVGASDLGCEGSVALANTSLIELKAVRAWSFHVSYLALFFGAERGVFNVCRIRAPFGENGDKN